ncbi:MAG: OmpA family protein [Ferruginibacter sp.]
MKPLLSIPALLFSFTAICQPPPTPLPKDAPIDVTVSDMRSKQPRNNELIVFQSQKNNNQFQGISDSTGKFSIRLPAGDKYDIFIMGFKDSISYNVMEIPALKPNAFYKNPFKVDIEFDPPKTFVLDNVEFDFGKSTLRPSSYPTLNELVEYLKRKDDERIEIGGHTDNVGTAARNLKLSEDRAKSVMLYLIAQGIGTERLQAKGYGDSEPIEENNTDAGRQKNRRTEVKIL